ncbi:hypothetical protein [Glutamicibacter sp. NPDC087344]|uniref:hypothetical protein n=1 Tax=Glutamicibacter sp. NPDC087344 TaxID=3363994 RepID=UPI0037F8AA1E
MGFGFLDPRELSEEQRRSLEEHRLHALNDGSQESREQSLTQLRELAGLGAKELAVSLNMDVARLKKLEAGQLDRAQLGTLRRHAEAMGCRMELRYVADGVHAVFG